MKAKHGNRHFMAKSQQNDLAILGRIKNDRTKNAVVQICKMSQSVSQYVASQDAIGGQHVK